jgi:hypothetical protein
MVKREVAALGEVAGLLFFRDVRHRMKRAISGLNQLQLIGDDALVTAPLYSVRSDRLDRWRPAEARL